MSTVGAFDNTESNEQPQGSLSETAEPKPANRRRSRQQLIEEYQTAALEMADPAEGLISLVTGDLMEIGSTYGGLLKKSLAAAPATEEGVQKLAPVLNDFLRVMRQGDRYAQLGLRVKQARVQAQNAKNHSPIDYLSRDLQKMVRHPR